MSDAAIRAEIEAALVRGGEAWARGDVSAMEALLSSTFTHTDIKGKLTDRTGWLAYLKTRAGATTNTAMEDVVIRVFGDAAVVKQRSQRHVDHDR